MAKSAAARRPPLSLGADLNGLMVVVGIWALVNALVRRLAGPSLSMDDAKTNLFTQVWQGGYQPDNPPLFEWLLILLKPITGGGLGSFLILKYAALMAAAAFLFFAARRLSDERTAFWSVIGAVLLYQIGWNFHQAFTHSALLVPAICAGLWASIRAVQSPGVQSAIVLGVVVGISLLTKYNAALFWLGMLGASLMFPICRRALLRPSFVFTPLIAALIFLPHGLWFLGQTESYTTSIEATLGLTSGGHVTRAVEGLGSLVISTLLFMMPAGLLAAWFVRRTRPKLMTFEKWLLLISAVALCALAGAVIAVGISNVSERYLIPVLLPAYLGGSVAILKQAPHASRAIAMSAGGMAALIIIVRLLTLLFPGPPFCDDCRDFIPYGALKDPIAQMIPEGAVLVVREENTGGNLVQMFPASPVRVFTSLHLTNPITEEDLPCFLVWSKDMIDPTLPLEPPIQYMETDPATVMVTGKWTHPLKLDGWRQTVWGVSPILKDSLYRSFCTPNR